MDQKEQVLQLRPQPEAITPSKRFHKSSVSLNWGGHSVKQTLHTEWCLTPDESPTLLRSHLEDIEVSGNSQQMQSVTSLS